MSLGGDEYVLEQGDYRAVVTEVGAGLRALLHRDRDLLRSYARSEVRPRFRGALLAPWPNRVVDGRYTFDEATYQLDLNEVDRGHALHGLAAWARFDLLESDGSSATLGQTLVPRAGYPFCLRLVVRYSLADTGLTCSVAARNVGRQPLPYGVGSHPYLLGGGDRVDGWTLELPAEQVLEVTPDRLVPTGLRRVAGTDLDFRTPRRIGAVEIDHAFTSLSPDRLGRVRGRVTGEDGLGVECEWDPTVLPWVQVHTADLPDPSESRLGLALEPMSCPPDAFNSGTDLVVLAPEDQHVAEWTIRAATT